ncbi:hypothetical protein AYO44_02575 [Planctomycetaceae bacterium SCGC AG-212-F19]|nr:hypothetical protein AYO44_02575 [Planctomycetaceae bacterium SCGC AG-212-F19]
MVRPLLNWWKNPLLATWPACLDRFQAAGFFMRPVIGRKPVAGAFLRALFGPCSVDSVTEN